MQVKILLLIGSNGKVSASNDIGWGDLADNIMDWEGGKPIDPQASERYEIIVDVPLPTMKTIHADAIRSEGGDAT